MRPTVRTVLGATLYVGLFGAGERPCRRRDDALDLVNFSRHMARVQLGVEF